MNAAALSLGPQPFAQGSDNMEDIVFRVAHAVLWGPSLIVVEEDRVLAVVTDVNQYSEHPPGISSRHPAGTRPPQPCLSCSQVFQA